MLDGEMEGVKTQNEILTRRVIELEQEIGAWRRLILEYRYQIGLLTKLLGHTIDDRNKAQKGVRDGKR